MNRHKSPKRTELSISIAETLFKIEEGLGDLKKLALSQCFLKIIQ